HPARPPRLPRALLAVLAPVPEPGRHRHRDPGQRDLALRWRRIRPRPSLVPLLPAGLLDRARAGVRLPTPPARRPPDRPLGRPDRTTPSARPPGSRGTRDGRLGRPRCGQADRRPWADALSG